MIRQPTAFLLLLLTALSQREANAQLSPPIFTPAPSPNPTPPVACSAHNGCFDCVNANCAWGIGTCFDSCDQLTELSCYSLQNQAFNQTAASVCAIQQADATDAALCGIQTSCESCSITTLSAPTARQEFVSFNAPQETCYWYEDRKTCSNLNCDSVGCSSPYCPNTPEGQCYFGADNCNDCLGEVDEQTCSWSGGACELNCKPDTDCYNPTNFPSLGTNGICQVAADAQADTDLCLAQQDCSSCVRATKASGEACEWYYDFATGSGWCGLGGPDVITGLSGLSTCAGVPDPTSGGTCGALASLDPEDLTCEACLDANCGWTTSGECVGNCDAIADLKCYTVGELDTVQSICYEVQTDITDAQICGTKSPEGCQACVDELKSDRRSNCQWYTGSTTGTSYCGIGGGCDPLGNCPSLYCDNAGGSSGGECATLRNCRSCLDSASGCVWDGNFCVADCDAIGFGSTCYSSGEPDFAFQSNFAICQQAGGSTNQVPTPAPTPSGARTNRRLAVATLMTAAAALV